MRRPHPDESALIENLNDKLRYEESQGYIVSDTPYDDPIFARNLSVFELNTHAVGSALHQQIIMTSS
jgi:hypothetical protein